MCRIFLVLLIFISFLSIGTYTAQAKPGYPKTVTVEGVFLGIEEGDFVYAGVKVDNDEVWVSCSEEDINKFLGVNAIGKKISLTYTVDWGYNELAGEHTESSICNSAKLLELNESIPQTAPVDVKVFSPTGKQRLPFIRIYATVDEVTIQEIIVNRGNVQIYNIRDDIYMKAMLNSDSELVRKEAQRIYDLSKLPKSLKFGNFHEVSLRASRDMIREIQVLTDKGEWVFTVQQ